MNGEWLKQKLAQNGFSLKDLAEQTGLPMDALAKAEQSEEAGGQAWDVILDTLNQYPAVRYPSSDILGDLQSDLNQYGEDADCIVFYGVNQKNLIFCCYQCLADMQMHGSNVPTAFLSQLQLTLSEALTLFEKQNFSIENSQVED